MTESEDDLITVGNGLSGLTTGSEDDLRIVGNGLSGLTTGSADELDTTPVGAMTMTESVVESTTGLRDVDEDVSGPVTGLI
jgi:hypothetical protein